MVLCQSVIRGSHLGVLVHKSTRMTKPEESCVGGYHHDRFCPQFQCNHITVAIVKNSPPNIIKLQHQIIWQDRKNVDGIGHLQFWLKKTNPNSDLAVLCSGPTLRVFRGSCTQRDTVWYITGGWRKSIVAACKPLYRLGLFTVPYMADGRTTITVIW